MVWLNIIIPITFITSFLWLFGRSVLSAHTLFSLSYFSFLLRLFDKVEYYDNYNYDYIFLPNIFVYEWILLAADTFHLNLFR